MKDNCARGFAFAAMAIGIGNQPDMLAGYDIGVISNIFVLIYGGVSFFYLWPWFK